jgi:hypothetical protein
MDISKRFSLEDFLAYLFPGVTGALGIYLLLLLTPLQTSLTNIPADFMTGIIFLVLSYIVGILLSGFSEWVSLYVEHKLNVKNYKYDIQLCADLKEAVRGAFKDTFKDIFKFSKETQLEWCKDYFYLCRSLVIHSMPNALQPIQRQSGLRQLRMNLLPVIVVWVLAGVFWGFKMNNEGGIALIVGSIGLGVLFIITTTKSMESNEWREVREVLTAFLVGYQTGAFKDSTERAAQSAIPGANPNGETLLRTAAKAFLQWSHLKRK